MSVKLAWLSGKSKALIIVVGLSIVAITGALQDFAGPQFSFALFYFFPIMGVAWLAGRIPGLILAIASALAWFLAELPAPAGSRIWVLYFNLIARGIAFVILATLTTAFRNAARTLEERVAERTRDLQREIAEHRQLERQLLEISDREQARIGQDLHDGLCQLLVTTAFDCASVEQGLAAKGKREAGLQRIAEQIDEAITQARNVARGLYPVKLESEGLVSALEELAANVTQRFKIPCVLHCPPRALIHDNVIATHLYRIAQEATHNALRHAHPKTISIRLDVSPTSVSLEIRDDGIGLPDKLAGPGLGLHIIDYRSRTMGGTLQIKGTPNAGTVVACEVPLTSSSA